MWKILQYLDIFNCRDLSNILFRLGQSEPAPLQHDMDTYKKRLQSFGFNAIVVDGHDVEELCKAFHEAENTKVFLNLN